MLVSYVALNPSYYQMLNPEGPWHAGAPGWSTAPVPGWGQNPALVGPKRLGVEGLGAEAIMDCVRDRQVAGGAGLVIGGVVGALATYLLTR